ncbi:hypothetical protein V8G54_033272 [Vigna mungo]|uniref:Integrase zinc-binding domain-containing protein n=1 Tax=Vigna mungo TaxID=3915 RepID=A0AAQ3MPI2_VIGMU
MQQHITTRTQQNWLTKLLGYNFEIVYKPGKENQGRRDGNKQYGVFSNLVRLTRTQSEVHEDDKLKKIIEEVKAGQGGLVHAGYEYKQGVLSYKNRLIVPEKSAWIPKILEEFHATPQGGHSSFYRTYRRLAANLYWKRMKKDVQQFVQASDICQRSRGFKAILVVVDCLSKYCHFVALKHPYTAKVLAEIFVKKVVRLHGIPNSVVSDRDPVTNRCLETYLRCFITGQPKTDEAGQKDLLERDKVLRQLKSHLLHAQDRMRTPANKHRKERYFDVGDLIIEKIGEMAYRLKLPPNSKIHPVFLVSLLKRVVGKYKAEEDLPTGLEDDRAKLLTLEGILATQENTKKGKITKQVLVHREGVILGFSEEFGSGQGLLGFVASVFLVAGFSRCVNGGNWIYMSAERERMREEASRFVSRCCVFFGFVSLQISSDLCDSWLWCGGKGGVSGTVVVMVDGDGGHEGGVIGKKKGFRLENMMLEWQLLWQGCVFAFTQNLSHSSSSHHNFMAAIDLNSNALISPKEEECETPRTMITHSRISDEPIAANPISVYIPDHHPVDCHHMIEMPTNKPATQNSSSKRGRRPKPTPEWIGNWDVESKKRPHSDRFDKTYRHKEKGFLCRSLLECERYEKHGIRPKSRRMKKQEKEKEESRKKSKTENKLDNCEEESGVALLLKVFFKIWKKEMVLVNEKNKEAETEDCVDRGYEPLSGRACDWLSWMDSVVLENIVVTILACGEVAESFKWGHWIIIMAIVNLSSSEESLGRGGRGYDDGVSLSATSKSSSSLAKSTERDEGPIDSATNVNSGHLNYVYNSVIVESAGDHNGLGFGIARCGRVCYLLPDKGSIRRLELRPLFKLMACRGNKRVFHGKWGSPNDFFFIYACFFHEMFVRLPFNEFHMVVLRAFLVICQGLDLGLKTNISIYEEHRLRFKKALRQILFLLNIPAEGVGFDVMKDICKGEMVSLNQIPDDDLEGKVAFGADDQEVEHGIEEGREAKAAEVAGGVNESSRGTFLAARLVLGVHSGTFPRLVLSQQEFTRNVPRRPSSARSSF